MVALHRNQVFQKRTPKNDEFMSSSTLQRLRAGQTADELNHKLLVTLRSC